MDIQKTIIFILLLFCNPAFAGETATTATHTYTLVQNESKLIATDTHTNSESILTLSHYPTSITILNNKAYIVGQRSVSIVCLDTFKIIKVLSVGRTANTMIIHGNYGYISNEASSTISVIDLTTDDVANTLTVGSFPHPMIVFEDRGFVVNRLSDTVSVIDLKSQTVLDPIPAHRSNHPMTIKGEFGYIIDNESGKTLTIDLKHLKILKDIPPKNICDLL